MMKIPTIGRKNKRKTLGSVVGKPENPPLRIYKQNDHEESIPIYLQEKIIRIDLSLFFLKKKKLSEKYCSRMSDYKTEIKY